ncbi:hypothetical protein NW759_015676 [Fusarium solani]|nr:hypothetical protein NW759_015676 [Fusarium solani]
MRVAEKNASNLFSLCFGFLQSGLVLFDDILAERVDTMAWHLYHLCINAKAEGWNKGAKERPGDEETISMIPNCPGDMFDSCATAVGNGDMVQVDFRVRI